MKTKEDKIYIAIRLIPIIGVLIQLPLILMFNCWNYIFGFISASAIVFVYIYALDKKSKKINNNKHNNNSNSGGMSNERKKI